MASVDTYSARSMSFGFSWPPDVTGLERIILSTQGDLQRNLSAFFARPITVSLLFSRTFTQEVPHAKLVPLTLPNPTTVASASPSTPIIQQRKVNLICAGKVVCTATSTVRIASPECAHLVLEEKYAIGQVFRRQAKPPVFELVSIGMGCHYDGGAGEKAQALAAGSGNQIWRRYRLATPEFECDILEEFPSRDMFTHCERWLTDDRSVDTVPFGKLLSPRSLKMKTFVYFVYALVLATVVIVELGRFLSLFSNGRTY